MTFNRNKLKAVKFPLILMYLAAWTVPFLLAIRFVFSGSLPFWYDAARDLMLGQDNLAKLTLIGPPSGIPGIFYEPYWIWILSVGLLFSKDPRVVDFLVITVPYFSLFPLLLFGFRKIFGHWTILLMWLLFIINFSGYATTIWSPNLAPLLLLLLLYINSFLVPKKKYLGEAVLGGVAGLILGVHISFGVGVFLGAFFYHLISMIIRRRSWQKIRILLLQTILFVGGFLLSLAPTLLFEARHGFNQIRSLLNTMSSSHAVVRNIGLTKVEILERFFKVIGTTLHISLFWVIFIGLLVCIFALIHKKRILKFTAQDKNLLLFIGSLLITILTLYLTNKNPIWPYHFIGIEVLIIFLIGFLIRNAPFLKNILSLYAGILLIAEVVRILSFNPLASPTLRAQEHVVKLIAEDAKNKPYTVIANNPSIYSYEYSYLFKWKENKDFSYDPNQIPLTTNSIYFIFPFSYPKEGIPGAIRFRTRSLRYRIVKTWTPKDGTTIVKVEKI